MNGTHVLQGPRRGRFLEWAVLVFLGSVLVGGCAPFGPRYQLVRVHEGAENRLRAAEAMLARGDYSAAVVEYEWVSRNVPTHPSAQGAELYARTLRQLISLQWEQLGANEELLKANEELSKANEGLSRANEKLSKADRRLNHSREALVSLKRKDSGLEEDNQNLKATLQELQLEIQKLKESYIRLERLERDLKLGR